MTGRFRRYGGESARPLLKDPIAVFSAEWLGDTFGMDVVVLIRHPAAFVNSIVARQLRHPFERLPALSRCSCAIYSAPYADEISRFAADGAAAAGSGHPAVEPAPCADRALPTRTSFVDVPAARGRGYGTRGIRSARSTIGSASSTTRPSSASWQITAEPRTRRKTPTRPRTSATARQSVVAWKRRLAPADVERIRAGVEPISNEFYADEDW